MVHLRKIMEEEFNWEEHGLMTDKELDEIDGNLKRSEIEGVQNILKYFDRIHDKLFTFNNILIGGYFALSQIYDSFSIYGITVPLMNLAILLFIEYRMMEKSRFEADVRKKTSKEIKKHGISINKTNLYSLLAILTTTIVVGIFIYNVFTITKTDSIKEELIKNSQTEKIVNESDSTLEIELSTDEKKVDSENRIAVADTITNWQFYKDSELLFKSNLLDSNRFTAEIKTSDNYEYLILNMFYDFNNEIMKRKIELVYKDEILATFLDENRSHLPFRIPKTEIDKIVSKNVGIEMHINYTDRINKNGMTVGILKFIKE